MNKILPLFLITLALLFSSCETYLYIPNSANVPMFRNKKELQATGIIGLGYGELQTAYSLSPHIGIIANGYYSKVRNYAEVGAGYYTSTKNPVHLELFSGAGIGNIEYFDFVAIYYASVEPYYERNLKYQKFFIQPDINYSVKKI